MTTVKSLLLIGIYVGLGRLNIALVPSDSPAALLWLPTGLAAAAFWRMGPRAWWPIFLASCIHSTMADTISVKAMLLAVSATSTSWLFARALRHWRFDPRLRERRDVWIYLAVAAATTGVAALLASVVFHLPGLSSGPEPWLPTLLAWWLGDLLGALLLGPLLMEFSAHWLDRLRRHWVDGLVFAPLILGVAWIAFFRPEGLVKFAAPALFLTYLIVLLAALRMGKTGAMICVLVLTLLASLGGLTSGPLVLGESASMGGKMLLIWSYVGTLALSGMFVAALQSERNLAQAGEAAHARHTETALRAIGDAVMTTDAQGLLAWCSPLARRHLGCVETEELHKQALDEALPLWREREEGKVDLNYLRELVERGVSAEQFGVLKVSEEVPVAYRVSAFTEGPETGGGLVVVWRSIAEERRRAAEELLARQRLSLALSASGASIWELEVASRRIALDERWGEMIGRPVPGPVVLDWAAIVAMSHPDERAEIARMHRDVVFRGVEDYFLEQRIRTEPGAWIWVESRGRVVERDSKKRATRIIGTNLDISARKAAEIRLRTQNAFLRSLQAITLKLVEQRSLDVLFDQILKSAQEVLVADFGLVMLRLDEVLEVKAADAANTLTQGEKFTRQEMKLSWRAIDTEQPVVVTNYAESDECNTSFRSIGLRAIAEFPIMAQGVCLGVLTLGRVDPEQLFSRDDIERGITFSQMTALLLRNTGSHEAMHQIADARAAALAESEDRFRTVFDQSPIFQLLTNRETTEIIEVNTAALRAFGYSRDEVVGRPVPTFGLWRNQGDREFFYTELQARGSVDAFECEAVTQSGKLLAVSCYARQVTVDGQACILSTIVDISERRLAEQRFQTLFEHSPDAMVLGSRQGAIIEANRAAVALLAPSRRTLLNQSFWDLVATSDRGRLERMHRLYEKSTAFWSRAVTGLEYTARTIDSREFPAHLRLLELRTGDESVIVATIQDLTRQRDAEAQNQALESQLRRAQKMDALGTLAGGVAHDFNNLLTAIIGHSELSMMQLPPDSAVRKRIRRILEAAQRSRDLVAQILTFSRREETRLEPMSLQPAVRDAVKLLRATIPAMVTIETEIAEDCPLVRANHTQIYQVVMNLGTNAWHALGQNGGTVKIELRKVILDEARALQAAPLEPGPHVLLRVVDDGAGIDRAILEKIFDPFFTTKGTGEGTGLGLAVVHGIVAAHCGSIVAENGPAHGASFSVYFPIAPEATIEAKAAPNTVVSGQNETLLLLDDDVLTGETLTALLERLSYRVRWSRTPVEALKWLLVEGQRFDVVITDLALPTMSGLVFAERVLSAEPGLPMLLISGNVNAEQEALARRFGVREVLRKPVDYAELSQAVRRALDNPPPRLT